jgi:cell division protein FtsZ
MTEPLYTEVKDQIRDDLPILFLAVGHAGIKLISHLPGRVPELNYAAVDSDAASLESCPFEQKVLIGEREGAMGSGGDMEKAREWMLEEEARVRVLIQDVRVVMLVGGLGGGTGSGAGICLAEVARDMGKVVLAAMVQPLEAEGGTRRNRADTALQEFREVCHSVMLFPLETLKAQEDASMLLPRLGAAVDPAGCGAGDEARGWLLPSGGGFVGYRSAGG